MKKTTLLTGLASIALAVAFSGCAEISQADINKAVDEANHKPSAGIYSPEQGILCDKKAGFCSDGSGISMAYTKEYLGQAAQDKLMSYKDFDTSAFSMSNGVYCETATRKCYNNKWKEKVDTYYTRKLF